MRVVIFAFLLLAIAACSTGDCSCALKGVFINSKTTDLVTASGCGGPVFSCSVQAPCNHLSVSPPPAGGSCVVTVSFADGHTQQFTTDFGALHQSTDCCGDYYDTLSFQFHVE